MFSQIFDAIEEWMRELLSGMISSNLNRMFTDVNQKTSEIAPGWTDAARMEWQYLQYDRRSVKFGHHADCRYYHNLCIVL